MTDIDTTIATTTPISTSSHPQVSPLGKSTTPDDLLDMYEQEVVDAKSEVDKEAEKQARVQEEVPKKVAANKLKKEIENTGKKQEEEGDETAVTPAQLKILKLKHANSEIDLPEEAEVPLVVNGKEASFKVKDILKDFSTLETKKRQVDQKLSWADRREKEFLGQKQNLETKIQGIADRASKGDFFAAVQLLAELGGKDITTFERDFFENLHKVNELYSSMTAPEREAFHAKRRAEFLNKKLEDERGKFDYERGVQQLQGKIQGLCKQNQINEEEYLQLYEELVDTKIKPVEQIEPEDVIGYLHNMQHFGRVAEALKSVDPALSEDTDLFRTVVELTYGHRDWSVGDIAQVVKDALGKADPKQIENLNRKVLKAQKSGAGANFNKVSSKTNELDDEMYDHFFAKRPISSR